MQRQAFAISTFIGFAQRLDRDVLKEVARAGFDTIELFALRTHIDYHNESVVADLQQWLTEAGLVLGSVHAPVVESYSAGRWSAPLNLASPDAAARASALDEALTALHIARRLPYDRLVVHAGVAREQQTSPGENNRDAARRSLEAIAAAARPLGVTVAVELIPNDLSGPDSLVSLVEDIMETGAAAICLDLGHAHLMGDAVDAIEIVSEHIGLVHAHDNDGRRDEHRLPFDGAMNWPGVLTALQKVGYDGTMVLELAPHGPHRDLLERARACRARMERLLETR